jgi:nucleoside-diphosphate-sugar epimerase
VKILITGATGFIGRHLVKALKNEGRSIKCLIRKSSQIDFLKELNAEIVYGDLRDKDSLKKALIETDIIYNVAGEVFALDAGNYYSVNVSGVNNLLEACSNGSVRKLIHLSSSSATGPNPVRDLPVNENSPCCPITPYGKSKLEGEKIVKELSRSYKVPTVVIRPPLVYGPGVSESSRVLMFLKLIHNGMFKIIGDGNNFVSLCYIDNLIHGMLLAEKENRSAGETYFLADARPYTINQIASTIATELGKELPLPHMPFFAANILSFVLPIFSKPFGVTSPLTRNTIKELTSNWFVDIKKAQLELGYRPIVELKEGVKKTVEWFVNDYLPIH